MNYSKLQILIAKNNLSYARAAKIGGFKSGVGFKQMLQNKTMTVSALEKLADYFKKPVAYFFDQEEYGYNNLVNEDSIKYGVNYKNKYIERLEKIEKLQDELLKYKQYCTCNLNKSKQVS